MITASRLLLATPLLIALAFLAVQWEESSAAPGDTERISVDSLEGEANGGDSEDASISDDGRFVAFPSGATDLVGNDTNETFDAFVRDRQDGTTRRISVSSSGDELDLGGGEVAISGDGRWVAFVSHDMNVVVPAELQPDGDVFLHDLQTGAVTIASVDSAGNHGDSDSFGPPAISNDGQFIAFTSRATNLVAEDNNDLYDAFVHDRDTGITERVSVDSNGEEGTGGDVFRVSVSDDGRYVSFETRSVLSPEDDNGDEVDIYIHDRENGDTELVSVNSAGDAGDDASFGSRLSGDARYVVFESRATNLVPGTDTNGAEEDIFRHDRQTGETIRVSDTTDGQQGSASSSHSGISGDGRYVNFGTASALVPNDGNGFQDVYVHDTFTGITALVSVDTSGNQGNEDSWGNESDANITPDGRFVVFISDASDLVPSDSNGIRDVFVRDVSELTQPPSPSSSPPSTPTPATTTAPPTASPTDTPPVTPTPTPGPTLVQGDVNCDGNIDEEDMTLLLEYFAELTGGEQDAPCPDLNEPEALSGDPWGDLNCDGDIDGLDAILVILFMADLELPDPVFGCFQVGNTIILTS